TSSSQRRDTFPLLMKGCCKPPPIGKWLNTIIDVWVIFLISNISNSYLYSKNSFFKRLQIVSNASGTNSGTMRFRLLHRVDLEHVRNKIPFPAGSQIGNHPNLKLLKIN